jgi:hypothetical protein
VYFIESSQVPDGWIRIRHFQYWDHPRTFVLAHREQCFLFMCDFDDARDNYPDEYRVFLLSPPACGEALPDWPSLSPQLATVPELGAWPTKELRFCRVLIDPDVQGRVLWFVDPEDIERMGRSCNLW